MVAPINTDSNYYNYYAKMNPAWTFWKSNNNNVQAQEYPATETTANTKPYNVGFGTVLRPAETQGAEGTRWSPEAYYAVNNIKEADPPNLGTEGSSYTNGLGHSKHTKNLIG